MPPNAPHFGYSREAASFNKTLHPTAGNVSV